MLGLTYNYQGNVLVSCGKDRKLSFWDMTQYRLYRQIQASYDGDLNQVSMSPDLVAVADDNGEVKVFHFGNGKLIHLVNGHSCPVTAI